MLAATPSILPLALTLPFMSIKLIQSIQVPILHNLREVPWIPLLLLVLTAAAMVSSTALTTILVGNDAWVVVVAVEQVEVGAERVLALETVLRVILSGVETWVTTVVIVWGRLWVAGEAGFVHLAVLLFFILQCPALQLLF